MRNIGLALFALALGVAQPLSAVEAPRLPAIIEVDGGSSALQLPAAVAPVVAPIPQARLPDLPTISNVVVDVRGARGGNGDVAASYLTVSDMIARKSLASRAPTFRFLMDEDAQEILAKMLGRKVEPGDSAFLGRLQFHDAKTLPKDSPADLYLTLANPTGKLQHPKDLRRPAKKKPKGFIPVDDKTVIVAQTVLGNTEDWGKKNPYALVQVGDAKLKMTPAGLAAGEQGVYGDYVARKLRGRSQDDVRSYLLENLVRIPSAKDRIVLRRLIEGKSYRGAELGLVYSIHSKEQKQQFSRYLKALVDSAQKDGKSYVLVSPLAFTADDVPKDLRGKVTIRDGKTVPLPEAAEPGKVVFIRTKALPHRVFVGLMAYSQIPPVIAGDGALSAAVALGKPFVSTKVDWNAANLEHLIERFSEGNEDPSSKQLMKDVFGEMKLERGLAVASQPGLFARLASQIPTLTDNIVTAVNAARVLDNKRIPLEPLVSSVRDEKLREDILLVRASRGRPRPGSAFSRAWAWLTRKLASLAAA